MTDQADFDHPIQKGAMLRRRHESERTDVLLEVHKRLCDIDNEYYEYELVCPSHTGYHQYREEDVDGCFTDTGLTNTEIKPVMDDDIRALYQELHDEHEEHNFNTVHDPDTLEPTAEECIGCRKRRPLTHQQ